MVAMNAANYCLHACSSLHVVVHRCNADGVEGSSSAAIYWNDGVEQNAELPIRVGADKDEPVDTKDPAGSNFRYRHGDKLVNALFADGHASSMAKGRIRDKNVYTNY